MYGQIMKLADDALKLQNKDRMDLALREIKSLCVPEEFTVKQYGETKEFSTEAEMVEHIQGIASTVIGKTPIKKGGKK